MLGFFHLFAKRVGKGKRHLPSVEGVAEVRDHAGHIDVFGRYPRAEDIIAVQGEAALIF